MRRLQRAQFVSALPIALVVSSCASTTPEPTSAPAKNEQPVAQPQPPAPIPKRAIPDGQIRREDIMAALSDGPPGVLSRVDVDAVVDTKGKFRGWKVLAVNEPEWSNTLRQQDIILNINGSQMRDPNEFFAAFQAMVLAPELSITLVRDGKEMQLHYPINDDPNAPALPKLSPQHIENQTEQDQNKAPPKAKKKAAR